ncbi:MAG: hypothetical protein Q9161_003761 [Pseudevernia consocians]
MSDQDPNHPNRPPHTFPDQPSQLLDANYHFTPYYVPNAEASRFPGHATPHLSHNLNHPAQYFPEPRNQFPGTDPIMDVRKEVYIKDVQKPSYDEVAALKDMKNVKDMTIAERHAHDAKEFSSTPPDALSQAQKQRWAELFMELFGTKEKTPKEKAEDEYKDPYKTRPRGELRKLKQLAELAGGKQE